METAKAARNRNDQSRPDTRRISSILKAPRTPLKTIGADNEDCQDEPTQPVETKRKSRRVSFAETNDIKYISNLKNNSPEMGLFPDLDITGGELQNGSKQTICATGNTRKQIIGMETLLNAPLHVSHQHNKENVFYPDAQDSNIDKTMMFLGEDTGYMDMTTCHTVNIIENDADDVPKLVSSSEMPGFASKVKTENNSSFENFWKPDTNPVEGLATSVGAQIAESQMEHFLTSLTEINRNSFPGTSCRGSKTTALGTSLVQCSDLTPCPKVDTKAFLSRLNDYRSGNAKEKQASAKTKTSENDITSTSSFPPQKNCIQFNSPTATNGKRQAVLTNEKDLLHEKQCSNGESLNLARNQSMVPDPNCHLSDKTGVSTFDLDDVEITSSQTVLNDYQKMHGALNPSLPSSRMSICNTTASNKTVTFSEDEYGMDMTAALTTPIEEIIPPATSEEEDIGMEMTTAHTMPIEKNCPLVGENKTHKGIPILGSIFYHEEAAKGSSSSQKLPAICSGSAASECFDTDDVEITRSQTVIDSKICVVDKPNYPHATGRKSLSCTPANKTVIFSEDDFGMEMTTALTVPIEDNTPVPPNGDKARSKLPSTNYCAHTKLTDCMEMASNHTGPVSHNMLPAEHSTSDDMDFTRSQTTVFDSKICTSGIANPEYSSRRKSLSCTPANKTVIFSDDDFGMEMTTALTVPIEDNTPVPPNGDKARSKLPSTNCCAHTKLTDCMEMASNHTGPVSHNMLPTEHSTSDDMDFTRSQTTVFDSKICTSGIANPEYSSRRKSLSCTPANKTVVFSDDDFGMEMTTALTVPIEDNTPVPPNGDKARSRLPSTNCSAHSKLTDCMEMASNHTGPVSHNMLPTEHSNSDDMDFTRSQTTVFDSKICTSGIANPEYSSRRKSLSHTPANKTVIFSDDDFGMEMTTALTVPIEENSHVPTNARKASFRFLSSKSIAHSGSPDHMELTSDQTDFISHNLLVTKPVDSEDIDISRSQSVVIDSKTCDIGHSNPSLASGRKSLRMPANRTVMFSDGDFGMEMTTAFTAPIEENSHVPSSGDKPAFRFSDTKCVPLSDLPDCMEISSNQSNTINQNILVAEPSDSDDRKITRSQTVAIDSQTCLTGRKSLSWESVKKTLSSEQGFGRKISTALSMPVKGSSHCTSVKASRETISSEQPDGTIMVSSQSAPNDEIHSLTTLAFVSNVEIRNEALGHHDKLRTLCGSEKISFSDMSTDPVSVEKNDNDIEMIAFTMPVEDNTCVKETTADTVSCFDLPDPRIRNMQRTSFGLCKNGMPEQGTQIAVSDSNIHLNAEESTVTRIAGDTVKETEKNLAPCDQRGLQKLSLMHSKLKANGDMDNVSVVDSAGTTCKENGVSLNDGDSGFIVHAASSQHENKSVRVGKKNSRRMSLADLQSKLNYMKAIIAEPVDVANECVTAPVLQLSSRAKDTIFESRNDNFNKDNENYQPALHSIQNASNEQTNMTAPVQCLKTKPRVGILSFGGFLPKLPQKNKTLSQSLVEITKDNHVGKLLTKNVLHGDSHLSSNSPVIYINDEFLPEISSEEDLTESIEGGGHANSDIQKDTLKAEPDQAADDEALLEKTVQNVAQGLKRPSPMDGHEDVMTEERKAKKPPDSEESSKFTFQVDRSVTDAIEENSSSTEVKSSDTTNSSNNSTYVRAEGTFDTSGQRCSQFETDFDAMGYKLDLQKKLEDGSIAVKEFLNFLGIDFVIHKPRQSVLPDNFALANEAQDLLVEKYINRPKQRVYEDDRQELSKMVENLKSRMLDQNKPLKMINQSFWEVVKSYSDEQFQSLGSALKARKVYFRKKSKTVSHEMKVGLYSSLVQTTQLAQQTLTEKIKEVDQLLQKLDDCLHDLQAELDATESKCFEEAEVNSELMLEAKQQELESLNAAVAENDRHISALQMENSNAEDKICKIQEETRELEKYSAILDRVIEWKLSVESESRAVFTFLYGSVEMEVLFQPHASTAEQTEQKVYDIRFHLQLDEGKSSFYARLIYKLISQFIQSKSNWVEKYPTRSSIPMLLHEVSLVVSRCRVLGEEIHRLWKWGSLKFDVVEIGCHDTQISFLFSSLKVFAKFEVTLAVDPTYPVSHLKVLSFKNYIGNTRLDQLEEIVSAVTPADNYLTRIVKKIHDVILC